jgi:hypothetical protein
MATMYRQCKFTRGTQTQYAWIEERGAIVGAQVELKSDNHEKWTVAEVGGRLTEDYVRELERDHAHQRKASDI